MYVCESTEITYDKNVVNFQVTITKCTYRLHEVCTRLSLIYFCSCFDLFAGCILAGMCNGYERKWKELVRNATLQRRERTEARSPDCLNAIRPSHA